MTRLQDLLNKPAVSISLEALKQKLSTTEAYTTFFGTRMVRLEGSSIQLNVLAQRVLAIADARFKDDAFSVEDRLAGCGCVDRLKEFYKVTDGQIKNSNLLTRIIAWIRNYFSYNPTRLTIDSDVHSFRLYTLDSFFTLFGDNAALYDGKHPSSDGASSNRDRYVKRTRLEKFLMDSKKPAAAHDPLNDQQALDSKQKHNSELSQKQLRLRESGSDQPLPTVEPVTPASDEQKAALRKQLIEEIVMALSHRFGWDETLKADYKTKLKIVVDANGNFSFFEPDLSLFIARKHGLVTVTDLHRDIIQIDLDRIRKAEAYAKNINGGDVTACMGLKLAGVSTTVNSLLGVSFSPNGSSVKTDSTVFTPVSLSMLQPGTTSTRIFEHNGIAVADCGTGYTSSVAPLISTVYTLRKAKTVKWVICIDWNGLITSRGAPIRSFLDQFQSFLRPENTILAFTKVPKEAGKPGVLELLQELSQSPLGYTQFLSPILANDGERIVVYDPCTDASRNDMLKLLQSVPPIENPRDTICAYYPPALEKTMWQETTSLLLEVEKVNALDPQNQKAAAKTLKDRAELLYHFIGVVKDGPDKTKHEASFKRAYAYLQTILN